MHHIGIDEALAVVKAHGYRVTKPKAAAVERPTLNCLGKPISALYDPNYKPKYKTPRTPYGVGTAGGRDAEYRYRQAIKAKFPDNVAMRDEIMKRNGLQP